MTSRSTPAEALREALEHVLDVWAAPSPEEFARLHRVLTGHDSCSSRLSDERVPDEAEAAQGAAPRAEGLRKAASEMLLWIDTYDDAMGHGYCAMQSGEPEESCTCGFDEKRERWKAAIEGAAPRAEGLDVDQIIEALPDFIDGHHVWKRPLAEHIISHLVRAEAAQGAAPRAEGLDVEKIVRATLLFIDQTTPLSVGEPLIQKVLARLSRPSDERVPESEER